MGFETIASYTGILGHIFAVGACNGFPSGKVRSPAISHGIQNWSMAATTEVGLLSSWFVSCLYSSEAELDIHII